MPGMRSARLLIIGLWLCTPGATGAQTRDAALPPLTAPVNDFAQVISAGRAQSMDRTIRALQAASGDTVVVATVETFQPYGDIREYAVKLFENGGRGIGQKGKDNGILILLAVKDRQVWVEVGYDLEAFVTDGFAGETSRQYMVPEFRRGDYGAGLDAGLARIVQRIAEARNVTLQGVPRPTARHGQPDALDRGHVFLPVLFGLFILVRVLGALLRINRPRRSRYWGGGGWSGWSSGVGPFGGGGGWGGGGGFGGGFGGFGGGRSGGGGGGASW